jgi:hypothetical protein
MEARMASATGVSGVVSWLKTKMRSLALLKPSLPTALS